ncbi:MAG: hypothetical protein KA184_19530 [Candidatus Hydrogenedentes bacterium]|nr:hypothetical protein [Candidatus Hydrogenedentota bacterium]
MTKPKRSEAPTGRHDSASTRREQALCRAALESGECDAMTDDEWVALCESVASADGAAEECAHAASEGVDAF